MWICTVVQMGCQLFLQWQRMFSDHLQEKCCQVLWKYSQNRTQNWWLESYSHICCFGFLLLSHRPSRRNVVHPLASKTSWDWVDILGENRESGRILQQWQWQGSEPHRVLETKQWHVCQEEKMLSLKCRKCWTDTKCPMSEASQCPHLCSKARSKSLLMHSLYLSLVTMLCLWSGQV